MASLGSVARSASPLGALEKAGVEFIPEDDLKGTRGPPKEEHTLKGPAQTKVIGLELGSGERRSRKRESVRWLSALVDRSRGRT